MKRLLMLLFLATVLAAQTPVYVSPVLSTETDGLFNAAAEVSTTINLRLRGGLPVKEFAIQAVAAPGVSTCTYNVKGTNEYNVSTLASETLDETDFATHVEWDVTGDFLDSGGNCAYTHSAGSGTCLQVEADLLRTPAINSVPYTFVYTVSAPTGDPACTITTGFAASAVNLLETAGTHTTTFTSAASAGDFVISCTTTSGGITFDDVSLKRVTPSGTDFVDLPSPVALSCLAASDERLHFFANRGIFSLQITLATLTGDSVVFRVLGR